MAELIKAGVSILSYGAALDFRVPYLRSFTAEELRVLESVKQLYINHIGSSDSKSLGENRVPVQFAVSNGSPT